MRYLNWDILLFPGSSRVPLQEFDTKCHVLSNQSNEELQQSLLQACANKLSDDHFVDNAAFINDPYVSGLDSMSQIPVVTSFVPSLECGSPFRISIHSWEAPQPSQILRAFKSRDETVAFEARIYIDGDMVTQKVFNRSTLWPEVVDSVEGGSVVWVVDIMANHLQARKQTKRSCFDSLCFITRY